MILLHDNTLCSGDAANEIKIWDWKNCRLLYNLTGHSKWVKCLLQLNDDIIISGSDDKTIKI
jgi:WD40 repeat protein